MTRSGRSSTRDVVVEPESPHRPGREVLGHRVGPFDRESPDQFDGLRVLEVERDVSFPDVQAVVHRRPLEAVRVLRSERVDAQEVGPARALDPQHRRPVLGEVPRRDRPRRARPELQDPQPVPRRPTSGVGAIVAAIRRESHQRVGEEVVEPRAGAGADGRAGAASPSADRMTTNDRGKRSSSPTGPKNPRASSCALANTSRGELVGASIRFVSHAMSYSSCIVWPAKYAATSASIARRVSSSAVLGEYDAQSMSRNAGVSTRRVRISRLATRALPPRSPKLTKPSRVGQISRVRPMFAPRARPGTRSRGSARVWPCWRRTRPPASTRRRSAGGRWPAP